MTRFCFLLLASILIAAPLAAHAEEYKPDDRVIFDVSAEDWVNTKTARVAVNVEASVNSASAGTTRAAMTKALDDLVKADWRLTSFNRDQDSTGMEHWSAEYEARVPENQLTGIHDNAKKASKPGLQLSVTGIDFTPTLDEMQAAMSQLRTKIYKMANEQLTALNTALPGRTYRIAMINFTPGNVMGGVMDMAMAPRAMAAGGAKMMRNAMPESAPAPAPMERSEKITLTANVIFAVTPAVAAAPVPAAATVGK